MSQLFSRFSLLHFSLLLLGLMAAQVAYGQRKVSHSDQQWVQLYLQVPLSEKWFVALDGGSRWRDAFEERSQYIIRSGVGYRLPHQVSVVLGFAHLGFYGDGQLGRIELRPYQDISLKQTFGKLSLRHRYRTEMRYFNDVENGKIIRHGTFNWRFRYIASMTIPLVKFGKDRLVEDLYLSVGDEILFNAGRQVSHGFFDQNRLLIGPFVKLKSQMEVALVWHHQFASSTEQGHFKQIDIFWLQIRHQLK